MMENQMDAFFKQAILKKHTKVYSDITVFYFEKIQEMKPKLFITWLTTKLNLPTDAIKYNSFIKAMYRHNKRKKKEKSDKQADIGDSRKKDNLTKISDFTMPDPTTREYLENKNKKTNLKAL